MPSTFGTATFEAGLPSRQRPQFLQRLGHDVSATGPAGLVSGLARAARPDPLPGAGRSTPALGQHSFGLPPWRAGFGQGQTEAAAPGPTIARLTETGAGSMTRAAPPKTLPTLQMAPLPSAEVTSSETEAALPSDDTPFPPDHGAPAVTHVVDPEPETPSDRRPLVGEGSLFSEPTPTV